jgi:putative ABC transport system permease protein
VLVVAFAALSLVLAMVGLFGILAYSVQQRIRDFGVRRALGASTGHVMALVARNAFWVIGFGAVAGLALSYLVGRLLATMLFGVRPSDPLTFALVAGVMTVGAMVSTIGPAWRAARIEPASALRRE